MRLYGRPGTASVPPHAALAEIGVPYEFVEIDRDTARTDPAYLALNPAGVVPTLVDGDLVLTESVAILLYLADRFPEARLAPEGARRPHFYQWLVFLTNTVQPTMLRVLYGERYGGGAVAEVAAADAERQFDLLDRELAGRDWLVADHRTAADLFLLMLVR